VFEKIRKEIDKAVLAGFTAALGWIKEAIQDVVKEYDKLRERGLEITDKGTLDLMADLERVHEAIQKAEPTVQPVPTATSPEEAMAEIEKDIAADEAEPSPAPPATGESSTPPEAQP